MTPWARSWLIVGVGFWLGLPAGGTELCRPGDVLVGGAEGSTLIFDEQGALQRRLHRSPGSPKTGMCFDRDGRLLATSFAEGRVFRFSAAGVLEDADWGGPFEASPETCVVDGDDQVFVGEADGQHRLLKFDAAGRLLATFRPQTERRGIDWVELAGDQCTLFYTSEGSRVLRYDVCAGRQLDDFATGLPGTCYALRLRDNGELMVACRERVLRFAPDGSVVKAYAFSGEELFGMNLDPRGEVFWTGGINTGNVYRVVIESGRGAEAPRIRTGRFLSNGGEPRTLLRRLWNEVTGQRIGGLAVCGERTQAIVMAPPPVPPEPQQVEAPEEPGLAVEPSQPPSPPPPPAPKLDAVRSFGALGPLDLGRLEPGGRAERRLDLSTAEIEGEPVLAISTDLALDGVVVEVQTSQGWQAIGARALEVRVKEGEARAWPVRVRVGRCCAASPPGRSYTVRIEGRGPAAQPEVALVPLQVEVLASSRWRCWAPLLAGLAGVLLAAFLVYGFVSPSRFSRRLGIVLSPEADLAEGFFHPIRAQRGTGSGFFRDARVFVRPDFRLSGSALGALARLRAHGKQVRISAVGGASLWRLGADGTWEVLPPSGEAPARLGTVYRDELGALYFELRGA
jgi:hypothetical protein